MLNRNFILILGVLVALFAVGLALGADGMVLLIVGVVAAASLFEGIMAAAPHDPLR